MVELEDDHGRPGGARRCARRSASGRTLLHARRENYFFDYVKQELIDRYGVNTVRKGGLKVYTTIDLDCSRRRARRWPASSTEPGDPASAIV